MSEPGEKKHWRLSTFPFRRVSGRQGGRPKPKAEHSSRRVSSVYLSDDTCLSGFVVEPEFDEPARTQTIYESSNHAWRPPRLPAAASSNSSQNSADGCLYGLESTDHNCYGGPGCCSVPNTAWDDDFSRRLHSAYEQIRSMRPVAFPYIALSSDPQMLRKQLGVPQHSVLNYPAHSSPDLPNPHNLLSEPKSPELPPAALSDESHSRTPKKPGLRIYTNIHQLSPRHSSLDSVQPAQGDPLADVPTEIPSPQRRAVEVLDNAHIACAPKPQRCVSKPSKLVKRRVEKPATSPSPLPSSRRRSVLRKPIGDTPSSKNAHKRQMSLPQIRSHSPLKVNIPLHHAWHDRRTSFNPSSECCSKTAHFHETNPRQTSENTAVLASLAWIGTSPTRSSCCPVNRRRHLSNPVLPDRFSTAIAVEDDSISDDALADRLERVRRTRSLDVLASRSPGGVRSSGDGGNLATVCQSPLPQTTDQLANSHDILPPSPLVAGDMTSDSEEAEIWHTARKALLCIREIIRTERKYQAAIKMLLDAQTMTPPPPSMIPYISALALASETLLKCFLEDPSAWGVSTAFVTSEDELEATMVSWCAVAGGFFIDGNDPQSGGLIRKWRRRKSAGSSSSSSMTKQTSASLSPRLPTMFPIISTSSKIKERMNEEFGDRQCPPSAQEGRTTSGSLQKQEITKSQTLTGLPPSRRPSVRDLAIQPIQRVMRYVLLYRDLRDCTPSTSPSRLLVERALEAATRIASHCDSAQRNPAFFHAS